MTVAVKVTPAPTVEGVPASDRGALEWALTTCDSAELVEPALFTSPLWAAVMLWVPLDELVALRGAAVARSAANATAAQPEIEFAPSLKFTVPVGALPLTVAVKVTPAPGVEGVSEVASVVELEAALTTCDSVELVEPKSSASPL